MADGIELLAKDISAICSKNLWADNGSVFGVFVFGSLFLKKCMEEFATTYNDTSTEWNGAELLTRVANSTLKEEGKSWREFPDLLNIEGPVSFFPLDSSDISK